MGEDKKPDVDLELCKNNETLKTRFKTLWQTLGEKIVAKSEMLKNLEGDKLHVCILLFLYCLQGIPLGLKSSIPLILTRRSVPYTEQARFTIASYPFSMKVLDNIMPVYDFWLRKKLKKWNMSVFQFLVKILRAYFVRLFFGKVCNNNATYNLSA